MSFPDQPRLKRVKEVRTIGHDHGEPIGLRTAVAIDDFYARGVDVVIKDELATLTNAQLFELSQEAQRLIHERNMAGVFS